jgi:hypothetical protein
MLFKRPKSKFYWYKFNFAGEVDPGIDRDHEQAQGPGG